MTLPGPTQAFSPEAAASTSGERPPILSSLAGDPEMGELIEFFVAEMPERVRKMEAAWSNRSLDDLRRLAHQIKGAAGGYGFAPLGTAAGRMEQALISLGTGKPNADLPSIRKQLDELVGLCQRVAVR